MNVSQIEPNWGRVQSLDLHCETYQVAGKAVYTRFFGIRARAIVEDWVFPKQVHGQTCIDALGCVSGVTQADAISTTSSHTKLAIQTADCVPILVSNGSQNMALHCGWRGLAAGLIKSALADFPEKNRALLLIGPHISQESYEVGPELLAPIRTSLPPDIDISWVWQESANVGKFLLNLSRVAILQLTAVGFPIDAVRLTNECTLCSANGWHSFRRDGKNAGRNWSVISSQPICG